MNFSMKKHQLAWILAFATIMFVACKEQSDFAGGAPAVIDPQNDGGARDTTGV